MTWRQSESAMRTEQPVSRAINVDVMKQVVIEACGKRSIAISAIEDLPTGGTRVVLVNAQGADQLRTLYKSKLLDARSVRSPWGSQR